MTGTSPLAIDLDAIPWTENPDGIKSATLERSRQSGELFSCASFIDPDALIIAHSAGTFLRVPGGAVHVDGVDERTPSASAPRSARGDPTTRPTRREIARVGDSGDGCLSGRAAPPPLPFNRPQHRRHRMPAG